MNKEIDLKELARHIRIAGDKKRRELNGINPETVAFAMKLECIVYNMRYDIFNWRLFDEFDKKKVRVINSVKMYKDWSLGDKRIDYEKRIRKDAYLYFCMQGAIQIWDQNMDMFKQDYDKDYKILQILKGWIETENISYEKEDELRRYLDERFYFALGRVRRFEIRCPLAIEEIILDQIKSFRESIVWGTPLETFNVEPILFLYGLYEVLAQ